MDDEVFVVGFETQRIGEVCVALLVRLLCCKLNFIPSLCSLAPPTSTPNHAPYFTDHSPSTLLFFMPVSLSSLLFLFLCSFSYLSSHSSTLSFLRLPSSVVPSFLSSCRRGMQPNVKRGNLIVLVAFAAFTPTVCPTQKVKTLQW